MSLFQTMKRLYILLDIFVSWFQKPCEIISAFFTSTTVTCKLFVIKTFILSLYLTLHASTTNTWYDVTNIWQYMKKNENTAKKLHLHDYSHDIENSLHWFWFSATFALFLIYAHSNSQAFFIYLFISPLYSVVNDYLLFFFWFTRFCFDWNIKVNVTLFIFMVFRWCILNGRLSSVFKLLFVPVPVHHCNTDMFTIHSMPCINQMHC